MSDKFESSMEANFANSFWPGAERFYYLLDFEPIGVHGGLAPVLPSLIRKEADASATEQCAGAVVNRETL